MSVANDITWHECVFKEFHSQKQRAPAMPQLLVIYVQMEILDKCATEKISSDIFNGLYCLKVRKRLRIRQWLRILSRISGHVSFNIVYWGGNVFKDDSGFAGVSLIFRTGTVEVGRWRRCLDIVFCSSIDRTSSYAGRKRKNLVWNIFSRHHSYFRLDFSLKARCAMQWKWKKGKQSPTSYRGNVSVSSYLDDFVRWHTSFGQCGDTSLSDRVIGQPLVADSWLFCCCLH